MSYLSEHLSHGELSDLSDSSGSSLLELDTVESLVEVDSVISGNGLDFLFLSFSYSWHFLALLIINQ